MKTSYHTAASAAAAGGIYAWTKSTPLAVSCLISGIFIDVDHIADFFIFSGEKFSLSNFFSWCDDVRWSHVTLLFHSYELYILFAALTFIRWPGNIIAHGVLAGVGLHLVMDQLGNREQPNGITLKPLFYFLTFRWLANFEREKMIDRRTGPQ